MTQAGKKYLIVIAGPTAIGKTSLAIQVALKLKTEIISADARQFYKELSIGTAKPSPEQLQTVKHHFINNLSITNNYDVATYEKEVLHLLDNLFLQFDCVILSGGSGLFIKAITDGLDTIPESSLEVKAQLTNLYQNNGLEAIQKILKEKDPDYYNSADIKNPHRILRALQVCLSTGKPYSSFRKNTPIERKFIPIKICLTTDREKLYTAINTRVDDMFAQGLLEEVKSVYSYKALNALQTVGYAEVFDYLDGKSDLEKTVAQIKQHTRNYAKRQMTWFRKDLDYVFFEPHNLIGIINHIKNKCIS